MGSDARGGLRRGLCVIALGALFAASAHAEADVQMCFGCHGPGGNSPNAAYPSIAGQPAQFINTQLVMFREKRRVDPQMSPVAAILTNADINALGKFFAAQQHAPPPGKPSADVMTAGKALAEKYNCVVCHGPGLKGQQHIPRLAGQQPEYLRVQLRGFKAGTRFDMDGNMTSAARPLSDSDIDVLANYLSALE